MNISVIGIGKLGLGFALLLEKNGYSVMGVDIFDDYVLKLNNKNITFSEPGYDDLLKSCKNFKATTSLKEALDFSDLIFIIVQTPNGGGDNFYDHSILSNLLSKIDKYSPKNKNIIIGCTIMPKYIDQIGKTLIQNCENCYLSYNPEFVAQGEIIHGFENSDIILVGSDNKELFQKLEQIYTSINKNSPKFCFMKPIEAEIVKISLNGFITTKISFANMISDLCDSLGADKSKVLNSVGSDSRIGNKYFKPGNSFGGPCFPRDTHALKQLLSQNNINSDILSGTSEYNDFHIDFQVKQLLAQNKSEYIIENVCYKENSKIPLIEQSANVKIAKKLTMFGKKVIIKDTPELIEEVKKQYGNLFEYSNNCEIEKVYKFWNDRPCNIKHSNKPVGSKEYFIEVTNKKYKVEPHILTFAEFENYNLKKVLEVGCGIGTAAQSFIESGAIYTGIDLSDYSINIAKVRLNIFDLNGDFFVHNIEKPLQFKNYFDLVYSFGVLHHTPDIIKSLKNIYSVLKPGGEFKCMLYAKNSLKYYQITEGLDQYEAQSGVPIANVYTNSEIYKLFSDFKDINIEQKHIFPYKIEEYKKGEYVLQDYYRNMPEELFKCMEKNLGWHLCIKCFKPLDL